jgi:hypothetical protein
MNISGGGSNRISVNIAEVLKQLASGTAQGGSMGAGFHTMTIANSGAKPGLAAVWRVRNNNGKREAEFRVVFELVD